MLTAPLILIATAALLFTFGECSQPAYPEWPNQFTQNFTDHNFGALGWRKTTATYYYDWPTKRTRLDRTNGQYDRYCGTNGGYGFVNTPCSQYVTSDGDRYLYYPEKNDCCFCCDSAAGCGAVIPTWMNGATYLGNTTVERTSGDYPAYYWDKMGGQDNYYWETEAENPQSRIMLEIFMSPNEKQKYAPHRLNSVDSAALDLPSICSPNVLCGGAVSICAALQR